MFNWRALLGWGLGLWLSAGLATAGEGGLAAPLWLLAVAAGFSAGPLIGAGVGVGVGCCQAALSGMPFIVAIPLGVLLGVLADLPARYFSRRHLGVAVGLAFVAALLVALAGALAVGGSLARAVLPALEQSATNALWMVPIYGIVLLQINDGTRAWRGTSG